MTSVSLSDLFRTLFCGFNKRHQAAVCFSKSLDLWRGTSAIFRTPPLSSNALLIL